MPAKLHFAKDSLALHLLLEGLEGLIDIVVANENLHGLSCILRPSLERSENCGALADTAGRNLQGLYQTGYFLSRAQTRPAKVAVPLSRSSWHRTIKLGPLQ
jgi:hypothetical protein